ncbi:MAG: extracellular solute-binding protein family 1 [Planctomycetaceae bacterium]|nr:extracellular solute-binding protein family 1 [Planctomycetaceae bacterium]
MQFYKTSESELTKSMNSFVNRSGKSSRLGVPAGRGGVAGSWLWKTSLILGVVLLAACGENNKIEVASQPYQDLSIQVVVPKGWQFKDSWDFRLEEWSARTGAKVELVESDFADLDQPLLPTEKPPQLILFPWTRRGELLGDKRLQPFPEASLDESQLYWSDVLQGLREKQCTAEGGPYLLPLTAPVLVCYYRADLLDKAGLKPPESWTDYQKLLDQLENWAPGLTAAEPWSPEFRATMFLARAVSYVKSPGQLSVFFDVESGNPYIFSKGFVKALEVTQAAVKKLPREVFGYDPITCRNLVVSGKAALAIGLENGPEHLPLIMGAASPAVQSKPAVAQRGDKIAVGICQLPGANQVFNSTFDTWESYENSAYHVTYTGFAGMCAAVPRSTTAEQSAAALNLLSSLVHEAGSQFPQGTRSPVRESEMTNAGAWAGQELSAEEASNYVAAVARSLRDRQQVSELPVVGHAEFRAVLTAGLTQALEKDRPAAETLDSVALQWKEVLKKLGQDRVLKSYRRALGLSERQKYE